MATLIPSPGRYGPSGETTPLSQGTEDHLVPQLYRVLYKREETPDTYTLELEPVSGTDNFAFRPGQFNMLYAFGVGDVPISISGDPGPGAPLVHTLRAVGAVTRALCKVQPGEALGVRGPFGSHWPSEELVGKDVVIVTGGIGLAPLRPTIYEIASHRADYHNVSLLYGARTPHDLLYTDELESLPLRHDIDTQVTVDAAEAGWQGKVGVVTKLIPGARFDPLNSVALICGPEVMMRFTIMDLKNRGLADEQIYVSLERNMKCAVGLCGHCQFGPYFICKDGPVFRYDMVADLMQIREI